jgi:hypothetical protein
MGAARALLLCGYLLLWVPLGYAVELLGAWPSLGMRGAPAALELTLHGLAAMLSATAGWMIFSRAAAGSRLAALAVVVNALALLQSLFWTVLPRNLAPGGAWPAAALAVGGAACWLVLIRLGASSPQDDPRPSMRGE